MQPLFSLCCSKWGFLLLCAVLVFDAAWIIFRRSDFTARSFMCHGALWGTLAALITGWVMHDSESEGIENGAVAIGVVMAVTGAFTGVASMFYLRRARGMRERLRSRRGQ